MSFRLFINSERPLTFYLCLCRAKKGKNVLQTVVLPASSEPSFCPVVIFKRYLELIKGSGLEMAGKLWHQVDVRHNKFTKQKRGLNKLAKITVEIAKDLELPNPDTYTSHSLRRTSATWLIEAGVPRDLVKKHGLWQSDTAVEGYFDSSNHFKSAIAGAIESGEWSAQPVKKVKRCEEPIEVIEEKPEPKEEEKEEVKEEVKEDLSVVSSSHSTSLPVSNTPTSNTYTFNNSVFNNVSINFTLACQLFPPVRAADVVAMQ
jgi:hypothetical protein